LQTIISLLITFVGDLNALINYVTFAMWLQRVFSITALLWIRYRKIPVHPEAIRMPIPLLIVFLLICLSLSIIPIVQAFSDTMIGLGIVASGFIFYFLFVWPTNLPRPLLRLNGQYIYGLQRFCSSINQRFNIMLMVAADLVDLFNFPSYSLEFCQVFQ
jgi:hypothetical protein